MTVSHEVHFAYRSIGGDFGSQIMTADGIILNNHMTDFSKSVVSMFLNLRGLAVSIFRK